MAPFQTSYGQYMDAAVAGMKVDSGDDRVETFAAEGAVGFGLAVVAGTDTEVQGKIGSGTFRGMSLRTMAMQRQADGTDGYVDGDAMNVLRQGLGWAQLFEDVLIDGAVTFRTSDGKFGTGTGTAVAGARWRKAGTSGGLGKVELVLPAVVS